MTETKTKIREVFIDISLLLFVSRLPRKCVCCSANSSAYCLLCDCVELGIY